MPDKYLNLNEDLYSYICRFTGETRDDPLLDELREETQQYGDLAVMQIGREQGAFLTLLTKLKSAQNALEIGTFTGYSAICIARGLSKTGHLYCCDISEEYAAIARRYWDRAGLSERITLTVGDARETLPKVITKREFDLVFIDADKPGYEEYYEMVLPRVWPGGLLIFDNMLAGGRVTAAERYETGEPGGEVTDNTRALHAMNRRLTEDRRVENVLVPIADGLQICRRRA
jgi:caffeoyl-CoA O-methyltransferase